MLYKNNLNKKLWLSYIKTYEDFNKKIPDDMKTLFNEIRKCIGNPNKSFKIDIDLDKLNFCNIILKLDVNFTEIKNNLSYVENDIIYYSNININDLLEGKDIINLPIIIKDVNLNKDKLISVISHEIRHIYDVFMVNSESDMKSFVHSLYYGFLSKNEQDEKFKYFLYLVYLSLEHELIARNTMLWEMFINCNCSKDELLNLYKKCSIYKSYIELSSFNYSELKNIPNILTKINEFIKYFGGVPCTDANVFFENWKIYFNNKSLEYQKESLEIIDNVYNIINENNTNKNIINVKDMLLDIYNKFIKKTDEN
jgi:hypothetical protein